MRSENRDSKGRFKEGNPGGPGRPTRIVEVAKELEYLGVVLDAVSLSDWREIIQKAVEQAKFGEARAREWLAGHLVAPSLEKVIEWRDRATFFDNLPLPRD